MLRTEDDPEIWKNFCEMGSSSSKDSDSLMFPVVNNGTARLEENIDLEARDDKSDPALNRPIHDITRNRSTSHAITKKKRSNLSINKRNMFCSKHAHPLPFNFFCQTCFIPVCHDCTVLEHDKSKGHEIKDIKEVLESSVILFDSLKKSKHEDLSKLQRSVSELQELKDTQMTNSDYVAGLINRTFSRYEELLSQRKKALLEELANQRTDKCEKIESEIIKSRQASESLSRSLASFKSARKSRNIWEIFETYSQINEVDLTKVYNSQFDLLDPITFANINETDLLQSVLNVGEIRETVCRL
ncbi:E3 ubiquitin-protein ligase TRIM71-like isoform X2 [Biomphalaria glabrata]|uniref:E3 ubiquitin-protein ligase TRIM71-like isoform X2 n=1 Tax=Biomphalaria glabrata TaxID=6526 RepID=A0A9W2ZKD3_BIOGL|nr:E3 ubiquitin-protein ligase TRIM71-like isoform X2 [Biomphalaria glabrata]XP_055875446.1 E3 ubiquitin-protein ligase TRIM71-like isoform X2 [Biomphalaria glabrata]XP_055875447.1 E3 ubiquitin-protein ligase TRIM71-like isoform X2 [Biomphalaria glabrata]XP_055875448.1 E3 ubiquitin-protein ligase TRIM71-like isoform X2 [Biomphalaria glabrata]